MSVPPLPAATVVLMRDRAPEGGAPEVLLVERHRASTVGAGAFVFPGGVVEPQDVTPQAARLSPGLAPEAAAARLADLAGAADALGHYVAAIRETFEETLVLLAEPAAGGTGGLPPREALVEARHRMHAGTLTFVDWVAAQGLVLATPRLVYFAHWITPEGIAQRFSARFFLIAVPPQVEVLADAREVTRHRWLQPGEAIAMRGRGDIHLMDPTVRNLELLAGFASTAQAERELARREVHAIMPKVRFHEDGSRTLIFPWDEEYAHG